MLETMRWALGLAVLGIVVVHIAEGRFGARGGFRGGFRGTSSHRGGSSLFGKSSYRYTGYGSSTKPRPVPVRTSLYTKNYGNYPLVRRSSSYNGFGLGLGAGLAIGYRPGLLGRPVGYLDGRYGYVYIHHHRGYERTRPIRCAAANVSEYLTTLSDLQELDIAEGEVVCGDDDDVCYGKMSILAFNLTVLARSNTTSSDSEDVSVVEAFEITIDKGCGKNQTIADDKLQAELEYNETRKCWTNRLKSDNDVYVDTVPELLIRALKLEDAQLGNVDATSQSELCVCDGWYCNHGVTTASTWTVVVVSTIASFFLCLGATSL